MATKEATFEESDRFLSAAAPEWKAWLTTALMTGLRVGELPGLGGRTRASRPAGSWSGATTGTRWRAPPKGGRSREVPLSDDAVATLQARRHLRGPYAFCEPTGSNSESPVPIVLEAGIAERLR